MRRFLLIFTLVFPVSSLLAEDAVKPHFAADFSTLGQYRNDSDFDVTERYYDVDGQSSGQVATYLRTQMGLETDAGSSGSLSLFHEMELGWNAWGTTDPGQPDALQQVSQPGMNLRHRQIWAQASLSSSLELRAGFLELQDPSRLFLDHLGGGLSLTYSNGDWTSSLLLGQLPENTLEGLSFGEDNFMTDAFVGGIELRTERDSLELAIAAYGMHDGRAIDRPIDLATLVLALQTELSGGVLWLHGVGQYGKWANSGLAGIDQNILSWAAQVGAQYPVAGGHWSLRALVLSADDSHDGNAHMGAFLGSGKNRSASKILTEDEQRDRYDNLDERIATSLGSLFLNTSGLAIVDASLSLPIVGAYNQELIVAGGWNINPDNALGHRFVGAEIDWSHRLALEPHRASLYLNFQAFQPGKAAAVFVNDVDRSATNRVYGVQLGFASHF